MPAVSLGAIIIKFVRLEFYVTTCRSSSKLMESGIYMGLLKFSHFLRLILGVLLNRALILLPPLEEDRDIPSELTKPVG